MEGRMNTTKLIVMGRWNEKKGGENRLVLYGSRLGGRT